MSKNRAAIIVTAMVMLQISINLLSFDPFTGFEFFIEKSIRQEFPE